MGDIEFLITVSENTVRYVPWDYSITLAFSSIEQFNDLEFDIEYSVSDRQKTNIILKNHMQALANDLINKLPGKKLSGYYTANVPRASLYHHWMNYDNEMGSYEETTATSFRWFGYFQDFGE